MKIVIFSDCLSTSPNNISSKFYYPGLLKKIYQDIEFHVISFSGATTEEAVMNLGRCFELNPDLIIFAWGINDALPRGLTRKARSWIIGKMYRMKFSDSGRLVTRTYFLNPLEYLMALLRKPSHYVEIDKTVANINCCVTCFKEKNIRIIMLSITPVRNYRFVNSDSHIERYNKAIYEYCQANNIKYIDICKEFHRIGLDSVLWVDKFHYSELGHQLVADMIGKVLEDEVL